jgi:tRNA splicing endonuclease
VPNSHPDDQPVTWGRYSAEMEAFDDRLAALRDQNQAQSILLERYGDSLATAEENRRSLSERVDLLRKQVDERKQRIWTLVTIILTGLALPLLLTSVTVFFHRHG